MLDCICINMTLRRLSVGVKKKILMLLIQIAVVTLALALSVATYAWYVSQRQVDTAPTTITAAAGAGVSIDDDDTDVPEPYMGQTGQGYAGDEYGGVDAPYVVEKNLTISFAPTQINSALIASIDKMNISLLSGEKVSSEQDETVLSNFTWRIIIDGETYAPDENDFAVRYDNNGDKVYYKVPVRKKVTLKFLFIFLDEASYANYAAGKYGEVRPFAYCGYEYMKATFSGSFSIGLDTVRLINRG